MIQFSAISPSPNRNLLNLFLKAMFPTDQVLDWTLIKEESLFRPFADDLSVYHLAQSFLFSIPGQSLVVQATLLVLERSPTDLYHFTCLPKIKAGHFLKRHTTQQDEEHRVIFLTAWCQVSAKRGPVACLVIQCLAWESNFTLLCEVKNAPGQHFCCLWRHAL